MIDATQKKLREAHFFLLKLRIENKEFVRNEPAAFGFYLSTFLSAARNVTFAMHWEEKEKYDTWFPRWSATQDPSDQQVCELMVEQRNSEQKRGGADVSAAWEFTPVTKVRIDHRESLGNPE